MSTPLKGPGGIERMVRATGHSVEGLVAAYRGERSFRLEFWFAAVLIPASPFVGRSWIESVALAGSVLLVLIVELLNSGIETVVDRVSLERHELSKRAKDLGSAAVFLALVLCAATWASALWQRFASPLA
jgi:diacylglycerol kinase (ATP)